MGRPKKEHAAVEILSFRLSLEEGYALEMLLKQRAEDVTRLSGRERPTPSGLIRLLLREEVARRAPKFDLEPKPHITRSRGVGGGDDA